MNHNEVMQALVFFAMHTLIGIAKTKYHIKPRCRILHKYAEKKGKYSYICKKMHNICKKQKK